MMRMSKAKMAASAIASPISPVLDNAPPHATLHLPREIHRLPSVIHPSRLSSFSKMVDADDFVGREYVERIKSSKP